MKIGDGCHDFIEESMNFNDDVILSLKGNDYRIHFCYMSKDEAINLLKNADLKGKVEHL